MLAHHLTFSCYGFWLPNDERGSGSAAVRALALRPYGEATKIHSRGSVACVEHDASRRLEAKRALKYPPFVMTPAQRRLVALAIERGGIESGYRIYACAIMKDHVHLVVGEHAHSGEMIMRHIKARATQEFKRANQMSVSPHPWGRHGWDVYLDTPEDVRRVIEYVRNNPIKDGEPPQNWDFVEPFYG